MSRLKISAISYLNTAPLMWDFDHAESGADRVADIDFDISYTIPSACAESLRAGTADIGIIPAAAYATVPDLVILPDVAIAARNAVRSILLVGKAPVDSLSKEQWSTGVHTVALDNSSMTSVRPACVMVASGDADALNLRHIRPPPRPPFSWWPPCAQGRNRARRDAPNRRLPLAPKRTFSHVPAKTALVLTGSAIALASYIGASSSGSGHDGRGARQTGLAAALTVTPGASATGTGSAGRDVLSSILGRGLSSSPGSSSTGTSSTGGPGTAIR